MALPYFFVNDLAANDIVLDEDTSKHITQVLRMKTGEKLLLTDGKGTKAAAVITDDHRKRTTVKIAEGNKEKQKNKKVTIAISLIKNTSRFEWFLEKATEIGVAEIVPLVCERTEKEKFRQDRMQGIITSAMLQSQQCWMTSLHQPTDYKSFIKEYNSDQKFIAHCLNAEEKKTLNSQINSNSTSQLILIGPEGDFTEDEIKLAIQNNFIPVSLGETRLRTETAGLFSAVILCNS